MKKLILSIVVFLLMVSVAWASPFLVCDPQAGVTDYTVTGDAFFNAVPAQADGSLMVNLANLPVGTHSLVVSACNIYGCGVTVPFVFTKTIPAGPLGFKVVK